MGECQDKIDIIMNSETDKQIAEILKKGLEVAEKSGNFVIEQAPDLVKQLITYKTIETSIYVLIEISLIYLIFRYFKYLYKKNNEDSDFIFDNAFHITGIIITSGVTIFTFIEFINDIFDLIKLIFAPKIYLLEYIAQLLS